MEISGKNSNQLDQNTRSTDTKQQLKQTTKAKQKITSTSTSGGGAGSSSSSSKASPLAEGTIHVLTTSNGSPYQSKSYN